VALAEPAAGATGIHVASDRGRNLTDMYMVESILLGVVATVAGAPIVWFLGRSIQKFRRAPRKFSARREVVTRLWQAAAVAPGAVAAVVENHDPHWHGPTNSWQTAETMIRGSNLNRVIGELEVFGLKASVLGWRPISEKASALRDACSIVGEAWGGKRQNTDADIAITLRLSQDLQSSLRRRRFRYLIALYDSAQTSATRPARGVASRFPRES
jgi:hypothetical protein